MAYPGLSRSCRDLSGPAYDREQGYLMPPSLREWLSEGHLAWFIPSAGSGQAVDAVGEMDLRELYGAYRSDGWGAAAYDPRVMVAILLYAYCLGLRSSRRIARALEEDVGFRVVAANQKPDFRTLCRFRADHEEALEKLFVSRPVGTAVVSGGGSGEAGGGSSGWDEVRCDSTDTNSGAGIARVMRTLPSLSTAIRSP